MRSFTDSQSNGSAPAFTLVATRFGQYRQLHLARDQHIRPPPIKISPCRVPAVPAQSWLPQRHGQRHFDGDGKRELPQYFRNIWRPGYQQLHGKRDGEQRHYRERQSFCAGRHLIRTDRLLLTVSGTTTINGGTLELGGSGAAFTGDFSISSGSYNSSFSGQNPSVSFAGNLTVSGGTFTAGTGVDTFSGSGKTITGTISIPKVTVNGTCTNAGTLTVSTALAGSGTLTPATGSALNLGGTFSSLTLATTANTPNTVAFTSASSQSVPGLVYNNLSFSGASTKILAAAVTVNSTLTISAGTLADGGFVLAANGNIVNNGTHTGVGQISLSGGSGAHSLTGTGAYQNLAVNDSNGATIASGTTTVNGTLTLTTGILSSSGGTLTLGNSASISRAAGSLSLTPAFGTSVNLIYNDTTPTITGSELPVGATTLNNLSINNSLRCHPERECDP